MVLEIVDEFAQDLKPEHVQAIRDWYIGNPKRWVKGFSTKQLDDGTVCMCVGGALTKFVYNQTPHEMWEQQELKTAVDQFATRGELQFEASVGYPRSMGRIVDYNDSEDTKFADVIALLDKVIASFDMEQTSESTPEI